MPTFPFRSFCARSVFALCLVTADPAWADGPTDPPDKGGTRPEALTLPSGPGSLQGLGEQVAAEPATGALTMTVPIAVPPAPAVAPDLALHYDSRAGNGPLGIGWAIDLPGVQRRTDLGLPTYQDSDTLLWSGKRLVAAADGSFRLRVEGEFTRLVALGSSPAAGFRADLRDGTQIFLGTSAAATVADGPRIFRWLPERVVSVHGDLATYSYLADGPQRYLAEVDYGRPGAPVARAVLRYETRPDPLPEGRAGFLVSTAQRLAAIETYVDGTPGRLVRVVSLSYDASSGLSVLSGIQVCGADRVTCLPALTPSTSQLDLAHAPLLTLGPPGVSLGDPNAALIDVDGDSLPDLVHLTPNGSQWWRNQGAAGFVAGGAIAGAPGLALSSPAVTLQDMDGDGQADLLYGLGSSGLDGLAYARFTAGGPGGLAATCTSGSSVQLPVGTLASGPEVRWLDLDGDGRSDLLLGSADGWMAWFNLGGGQLGPGVSLTPPEPGLSFSDPTLRLADMNGDGLVDLVRLQSGSAQVWLNVGFGSFAPAVALAGAPEVGGDDLRLYLGDADGDGLPDVFYVAPGRLSIWRNLGFQRFGPEIAVLGAPSYDPLSTTVRVADLLGHGVKGIVYSGSQNDLPFLWYLDPTAGVHPHLLIGVDNGVGGQRTIGYQSSADLAVAAATAGQPFSTQLPFPTQVVTAIRQSEPFSPTQSDSQSYRDPYWNPVERLFQGFAHSETGSAGDLHSQGLLTAVDRHSGASGEDLALVGRPIAEESRATDGTLLQRTRRTWVAQQADPGVTGGEAAAFAALSAEIQERWEGQATPVASEVRRSFDGHGNLIEEDQLGVVGSGQLSDPAASVLTLSYAETTSPWILGKLAERTLRDGQGHQIQSERHFYDGTALEGLPLGQLTLGDESRAAGWLSGQQYLDLRRTARDSLGNAIAWLDAEGRRVEVDYDSQRQQFPVEERHFPQGTSGPAIRTQVAVDPATGQALSVVAPDGATTRYGWDALGREISIARPEDPADDPGELRSYLMTPAERSLTRRRRATPAGPFSLLEVDLYDGFFRPLAHAQSAELPGQWAIADRVARDARGAATQMYLAYFGDSPGAAPPAGVGLTEELRDALGRPLQRKLPAGGELSWAYQPLAVQSWDTLATAGQAESSSAVHDFRGGVVAVILDPFGPQQRQFTFGRDVAERVVSRTTPLGASAREIYDGLGRLVAAVDPDSGPTAWSYDDSGALLGRTDARGQQTRWTYDGAGRTLNESDAQGVRASFCYDDPPACGLSAWLPRVPGAAASARGRLLSVSDRSGRSDFAYDAQGRVAATQVVLEGLSLTTEFAYDLADRLQSVIYPDGAQIQFDYGNRGLVLGIPGLLASAQYTASGLPVSRKFASGLEVDLRRDGADRLVGVVASVAGASVAGETYQLTSAGAPAARSAADGTTVFTLDEAERLGSESGPSGQRSQTYDADDRLTARVAAPADPRLPGAGLRYGQGGGPHALAADARGPIAYDAAGERSAEGPLSLDWDANGQLVGARSPAATALYAFGFDGRRRRREVQFSDGRRALDLDFGGLVEIRDGVLWKHVLLGGERIASLTGVLP